MSNREFQDRVALVTGAASGIGRATAIAFARAGARVAVVDRDAKGADETVELIRRGDGAAIAIRADVASSAEVGAMIARTVERFGGLDVAFNNAGIEVMSSTVDCTEEEWDRLIGINLRGVWLCMKAEIPRMRARGGGAIINCASIAGLVGFPGAAAYVASKHAVVGLTRGAALELAREKIRVNAICPGVIRTPMIDRVTHREPAKEALYANAEPVGRLGEPEEVAAAVLWLASPAASFVTGTAIPVDGGWVAQ